MIYLLQLLVVIKRQSAQSEFAGVSLDDEASHLLEFQQAYQASARILQTARELFEALIKVV